MSNNTSMENLFIYLHGSLPYEYDVKLVKPTTVSDSIKITKAGAANAIYLTTYHDNADTLYMELYDAEYDDFIDYCAWDLDSPDLSLTGIIDDIRKNL